MSRPTDISLVMQQMHSKTTAFVMSNNPRQGTQEILEGSQIPGGAVYTTSRSHIRAAEIQD